MPHPKRPLTLAGSTAQNAAKVHQRNNRARPRGPRLVAERSAVSNAAGTTLDLVLSDRATADAAAETVGWSVTANGAARTLTFISFTNGPDECVLRFTLNAAVLRTDKVQVRYDGTGTLRSAREAGAAAAKSGAMFAAETVNNLSTV